MTDLFGKDTACFLAKSPFTDDIMVPQQLCPQPSKIYPHWMLSWVPSQDTRGYVQNTTSKKKVFLKLFFWAAACIWSHSTKGKNGSRVLSTAVGIRQSALFPALQQTFLVTLPKLLNSLGLCRNGQTMPILLLASITKVLWDLSYCLYRALDYLGEMHYNISMQVITKLFFPELNLFQAVINMLQFFH